MIDLINRLRLHDDERLYREADELMSEAADALDLQAGSIDAVKAVNARQAERVVELEAHLERKSDAVQRLWKERDNLRHELKVAQEGWRCECSTDDACRFARERDALRAELAEIAADEPVMFAYEYSDGSWHDASSTEHSAGMKPLFTRPMPAQDVTELAEALEKLARLGNGEHYGNSDGNMIAHAALSKYKGAKR